MLVLSLSFLENTALQSAASHHRAGASPITLSILVIHWDTLVWIPAEIFHLLKFSDFTRICLMVLSFQNLQIFGTCVLLLQSADLFQRMILIYLDFIFRV